MRPIFFDTEFTGLYQEAQLLSIALVPDRGKWFYGVFTDVDIDDLAFPSSVFDAEGAARQREWLATNVVPHLELTTAQLERLPSGEYVRGDRKTVADGLRNYLATFDEVVMWADVPAYDWVLFCELFGGAFGVPKNVHYIVRDLATLLYAKGYDVDIDRFALAYGGADAGAVVSSSDGRVGGHQAPAETGEGLLRHNALGDALACKACWEKVSAL